MLVRLLYASRLVTVGDEDVIDSILKQSRRNNPGNGITGVMIYSGVMCLQALEGGRTQVSALYTKIANDPRHVDVTLIKYEEITERRFGVWSMGQVNMARVNASVVLKYSPSAMLDPYSVQGDASLQLIEELMESASIIGRT